LILLCLPSNTLKNVTTGAIVEIATTDKFCKNSRLYSGNGIDRGKTAQYDKSAMLMVPNITFWMESKLILVLAPDISTSSSDSSSVSWSRLSSSALMTGASAMVTTVEAAAIPLLLPLNVIDIDDDCGDMNADSTPIPVLPPSMDIPLLPVAVIVASSSQTATVAERAFPTMGVGIVNVLDRPSLSLLTLGP
jgi:hypothetical protein